MSVVVTWKSEVWEQNCVWLFYSFSFERNYDVWKSKYPCFLLDKNINVNKNETESKMENPTGSFRDKNLVLQLVWESRIKSETVMSWSSHEKKERIFRNVYFVRKKIFNIYVLSQYIFHWINFQNIYTFTYQKTVLHTLLLLGFKITKSLLCLQGKSTVK